MKKLILSIILLNLCYLLNAQSYYPFPDSNATWDIYYECCFPNNINSSLFTYNLSGKDTLINNVTYKKIDQIDKYMPNDTSYSGALREDSLKRIYYFPLNEISEFLIYDFSKSVGDSIEIFSFNGTQTFNYHKIEDMDSVMINNNYRKRYMLSSTLGGIYYSCIEGIGSDMGLIEHAVGAMPLNGSSVELICHSQNGDLYYSNPNYTNCIAGISESIKNGNKIIIYPNPINDKSVLELNDNGMDYRKIEIFNLLGKCEKRIEIGKQKRIELNINDLAPGLYWYKLTDHDNLTLTGKIIIN